jgi:flagellar motor protein MotB
MKKLLQFVYFYWIKVWEWFDAVVSQYLYIIPTIMGTIALSLVLFVVYLSLNAVNDLNNTIKSIPTIVHSELAKTREFMKQEFGNIQLQHEQTRDELTKSSGQTRDELAKANKDLARRLQMAEYDRKKSQDELKKIEEALKKKHFSLILED